MIKVCVAVLACIWLTTAAQAQTKIGIINLQKVFDSYWKTKQADNQLKDRASEFDKQRKDLIDSYEKANEEYKKLLESSNDQAISVEEREKRKKTAENKLRDLKEIETQITQFDRTARSNLSEQQRRMRELILKEIQEIIITKSKALGFTMVFDSAAQTVNGTQVVLFNNGENDISEDVLKQLNASAPADILKSTETKPADKAPEKKDKK